MVPLKGQVFGRFSVDRPSAPNVSEKVDPKLPGVVQNSANKIQNMYCSKNVVKIKMPKKLRISFIKLKNTLQDAGAVETI